MRSVHSKGGSTRLRVILGRSRGSFGALKGYAQGNSRTENGPALSADGLVQAMKQPVALLSEPLHLRGRSVG